MNSLKTTFIVAVLLAVAYGVYVSINRSSETPETADTAPAWSAAPQVEIPPLPTAPPQFSPNGSAVEAAPPFSSGPTHSAGAGPAPEASIAGVAASAYPPPGASPPAIGLPPHGAASPYAPNANSVGPTDVAQTGSVGAGAGLPAISGQGDTPGAAMNPVRGGPWPPADPRPDPVSRNATSEKFDAFFQTVRSQLDKGHLAEAHLALSSMYDNPNVPPEQVQAVTNLLDQLAGSVVYSRRHELAEPYRVQPGETLEQIAKTYNVPWQVLAKVNGIRDPNRPEPGRELKVIPGPFSALIDLKKYELTLMVGGRYAGRFPIGVGRDHADLEGSYTVCDKIPNPPYYSPTANFSADDPKNPLGDLWIDLGNQIGIHGTDDPQNLHQTGGRGSIRLSDRDIEDLYGILSIGSRVIIRR